jgi:hypothetical protein
VIILPDEKSCNNCGALIPADSLFCEKCGQPLGGVPPEQLPYEPRARPYESPPPARVPPPYRPKRRTDTRFLVSVVGTAVAVILLLATVIVPALTSITGPHVGTDNSPSFLATYLATFKNLQYADKNKSISAWDLTWINSTSARLQRTVTYTNGSNANRTISWDDSYIVFPTSQAATDYLNAMNKTAYSLASTEYSGGGAYEQTAGHAPQIYKTYEWHQGTPSNFTEYRAHFITQFDNMVEIETGKILR